MNKITVITLTALALSISFSTKAGEYTQHQKLAKEYIDMSIKNDMMNTMVDGMVAQITKPLMFNKCIDQKNVKNDLSNAIIVEINKVFEDNEKEIISLFTEKFSEGEIKEILVFYKSPVGKKLLNTKDLGQKMNKITATQMQKRRKEMMKSFIKTITSNTDKECVEKINNQVINPEQGE